jgi:hypothetical protein
VVGSCECGNKDLGSAKHKEFYYLSDFPSQEQICSMKRVMELIKDI